MAALAAATGQRDFIFPEGAALALGVGVLRTPEWSTSRWRIVLLVPLCALAGHLLACAHAPSWVRELTGVTIALLLLETCGSRVAPALSAAVLPVVFDVRSWAYPIVVLLTCIAVVATLPAAQSDEHTIAHGSWPRTTAARAWLVIGVWITVAGPLLALPAATLSPPLFVSTLEWMSAPTRTLRAGIHRYGLLVAAAITGTLVARVCPAEWIAAPLAVLITLTLMNVADCRHAPALAISLIASIVHSPDAFSLITGVAVGAGVLYLAGSATIAKPRMIEARCRVRLGRPAPARSPVADESSAGVLSGRSG
jgi:hypothetical protein